jgi:geranylgeranyl pyrophosphate synthase
MGKATSDIETKKKSYPVLVAFDQADAQQRDRLTTIYQKDTLSADDVEDVRDVLARVGADKETQGLMEIYLQRALAALDSVGIQNDDQKRLRELALFLVERAY